MVGRGHGLNPDHKTLSGRRESSSSVIDDRKKDRETLHQKFSCIAFVNLLLYLIYIEPIIFNLFLPSL